MESFRGAGDYKQMTGRSTTANICSNFN